MNAPSVITIRTVEGPYEIWQAVRDLRSADGDIKTGDWLYQPSGWQGDIYSPSYATREAAEAAVFEEIAARRLEDE